MRRRGLRVVVHTPAVSGVGEIIDHIAQDNPTAARRFGEAVDETVDRLRHMPLIGTRLDLGHPRLSGLRNVGVRGFRNYRILFIPDLEQGELHVLHVGHAARDLGNVIDVL